MRDAGDARDANLWGIAGICGEKERAHRPGVVLLRKHTIGNTAAQVQQRLQGVRRGGVDDVEPRPVGLGGFFSQGLSQNHGTRHARRLPGTHRRLAMVAPGKAGILFHDAIHDLR